MAAAKIILEILTCKCYSCVLSLRPIQLESGRSQSIWQQKIWKIIEKCLSFCVGPILFTSRVNPLSLGQSWILKVDSITVFSFFTGWIHEGNFAKYRAPFSGTIWGSKQPVLTDLRYFSILWEKAKLYSHLHAQYLFLFWGLET